METVEEIETAENAENDNASSVNDSYLIFSVKKKRYALNTTKVQEIMSSAKIHPLPFVPRYIEGVVNCRGLPYTVVNTLIMNGEEDCDIDGSKVLVFKRSDDQFALHISNIEVFFEPEEEDVLSNGVKYKAALVPFFDADSVEERLCIDLDVEED